MVFNKLKALVWDELKELCSQLLGRENPNTFKKLEGVIIPPDGVNRKLLDEVIDGIPPDEGCEITDGEYTNDEWNNDVYENANVSEYENSTGIKVP